MRTVNGAWRTRIVVDFTCTWTPANGWNRDGVACGLSDREDFVNAWELFAVRVELFLGGGFDVFVAPADGHAVVIARTQVRQAAAQSAVVALLRRTSDGVANEHVGFRAFWVIGQHLLSV